MNSSITQEKPSGSTIAAVLMGYPILVFLALSAPSWGAAPYLGMLVFCFMLFMCFTDRTNAASADCRSGQSDDSAGEAIELCFEAAHACHHAGYCRQDGGWSTVEAGYSDCDCY